jgi:hypothetical protein
MKMSKEQLKVLVKECLIELLSEGLGSTNFGVQRSTSGFVDSRVVGESLKRVQQKRSAASGIPSRELIEAVKRESNGNAVLQDILADTAVTTLPAMLKNSTPSGEALVPLSGQGVGQAEMIVASASPEELFGDKAASKWSALAFMPKLGPKVA